MRLPASTYVAGALAGLFALNAAHLTAVAIGTELSLPKDATRIGWREVNGGRTILAALEYKTADGRTCLRDGINDSCRTAKILGLDHLKPFAPTKQ